MSPKLSVIVPVYGVEKYIERCARSLFDQTLDHVEYIFVDDCTPDRSMELLQGVIDSHRDRFAALSWSVVIERMPHNSGQAAVRRHALQLATGEYVIHCDSDDWVERDMFRLMYEKAQGEEADIVVCDYRVSDGEHVIRSMRGCPDAQLPDLKRRFIGDLLCQRYAWSVWNKLFRRTACYGDHFTFPKEPMGEDLVIVVQCLLNGGKMVYLPQTLYNYFYNPQSISHADSEDKLMANYRQFKTNADTVMALFSQRGLDADYAEGLFLLKWYAKKGLWALPYDRRRRTMWLETYSEINSRVLFCKNISLREKVKFLLTLAGLFPPRKQSGNQ